MSSLKYICESCFKGFRTEGDRSSHVSQAIKCRYLLDKPIDSDDETTSHQGDIDDFDEDPNLSAGEWTPEDPFDVEEMGHDFVFHEAAQPSPSPSTNTPTARPSHRPTASATADSSEAPQTPLPNRRAAQFMADTPPQAKTIFPSAGKVLENHEAHYKSYTKKHGHRSNPYHPFHSKLEWEIARWAKDQGPGANAMTKLLAIPGVSRFHTPRNSMNKLLKHLSGCRRAWAVFS